MVHICSAANGPSHRFRGCLPWRSFLIADSVCIANRVGTNLFYARDSAPFTTTSVSTVTEWALPSDTRAKMSGVPSLRQAPTSWSAASMEVSGRDGDGDDKDGMPGVSDFGVGSSPPAAVYPSLLEPPARQRCRYPLVPRTVRVRTVEPLVHWINHYRSL